MIQGLRQNLDLIDGGELRPDRPHFQPRGISNFSGQGLQNPFRSEEPAANLALRTHGSLGCGDSEF